MGSVFLAVFDQFRYISGTLAAVYLFCIHAAPKRPHFAVRVIIGYVLCFLAALCFLPLQVYINQNVGTWILASAPYWLFMSFMPVLFMMLCFELHIGNALFRCLIGSTVEVVVTALVRYLLVLIWFPTMPQEHSACYIVLTFAVYLACYAGAYQLAAKNMQKEGGERYLATPKATFTFFSVYLTYIAINGTVKVVCEKIIVPLCDVEEYVWIYDFLCYFCVGVMIAFSLSTIVVLYYVYEAVVLQNEKQLFNRLLAEKEAQYEFSRENMELINRKCHDLKHQLKALEVAGEDERQEMLQETKKAVVFYDAAVHTGNEVLDTILTEKSVLCVNRNIRLSCMADTNRLEHMRVIDLYTMLGNAIDNAIECVDRFADDEKKVISLSVREQGRMLYISVENYFEGELVLRSGYPVTSKKDQANHGFGVKSIHMIAKRYGGDIRVSTQNHIFLLQIIIPAAGD